MKVIKKNGFAEEWDDQKLISALSKAANRAGVELSDYDIGKVISMVLDEIGGHPISVGDLHTTVEKCLTFVNSAAGSAYKEYRNYKKDFVELWDEVYTKTKDVLYRGDRENANFLSTLTSTKGSLIRGYVTKELYKKFNLTPEELNAMEEGYIYGHDLKDMIFGSINCCLFDMGNVLKGGFEMANLKYKEPSAILSAMQVAGDVILNSSSQQFGGFTVPDIDKILAPYCKKSFNSYKNEAGKWGVSDKDGYALANLKNDLLQGFQGLEMKLNSIPSSRGDFAFTTFSFANLDTPCKETREYQRLVCEAILKVRMKGQGESEPVVFPKLVFLFSQEQYDNNQDYRELFNLGIKCSSRAMYPDYLAIDTQGSVADAYKESGEVISPMGCRAYLSDFKDNNGKSVYTGRANIGAVALNLPMIWQKSRGESFYADVDYYLDMIRKFHKKRYDVLSNTPCSSNPLAFCEGGLYKGSKGMNEKIGYDIIKAFTASFGVTALNELNVLMTGNPLHKSDRREVNKVMDYINEEIERFKKEDDYLYAVYQVPAESLCGTQVQQFRKKFGIIEGVSDKEYFSNGFHIHVSADITPFEKQDMEYELFHKSKGGRIQYCRFETSDNFEAIKSVVLRGMSMGFYQGVNLDLVICEGCGHRPNGDVDECPECGSHNIMALARACGYCSYRKVGGDTRFNDAKLAEMSDRVSM